MASWLSWLPTLPSINISLPSGIQGRFISFVLKKSLGHLFKPDQLDVNQIDSQIGSGYVQVSDLQLNDQAINELLSGLPVELVEGTVGSVTARIPWPNPISSVIGLSLDSLSLTLSLRAPKLPPQSNLAESVASVAESFIHDELTPREEAALRESIHSDAAFFNAENQNVPGGIDPFMAAPEDEELPADFDPEGVSVFATLIERILARFKFDAVNTKIILLHPDGSSLSVSIPEIRYYTQAADESNSEDVGEVRTVSISGLTVAALRSITPSPTTTTFSRSSRRSTSSASSSSSLDEETHLAMSQSLAFLPPRPPSPTGSVASSMYQSAISDLPKADARSQTPSPRTHLPPEEDVFLSLGTEPIIIKLITPPMSGQPGPSSPSQTTEKLRIVVTAGHIACAVRAWHIRLMLNLAGLVSSDKTPKSAASDSPSVPPGFEASLTVKGLILLVLPPMDGSEQTKEGLAHFFAHPLSPPRLSEGYVRLQVETVSAQFTPIHSRSARPPALISVISSLSISEFSLFTVCPSSPEDLIAYPLLISDSFLSTQYTALHSHPPSNSDVPELPSFDVIDWTDSSYHRNGLKVSTWRTKQQTTGKSPRSPEVARLDAAPKSCFSLTHTSNHATHLDDVEVNVSPLHVFVDLELALSNGHLMAFIDDILPAKHVNEETDDEADTPPATPHYDVEHLSEKELERRRLERMVIEDLNLELDYGMPKSPHPSIKEAASRKRSKRGDSKQSTMSITLPMIRVQARCGHSPRSGALILDFHDLVLSNEAIKRSVQARFGFSEPSPNVPEGDVALVVQCKRLVIAYAPVGSKKAFAISSIGSLSAGDIDETFSDPDSRHVAPLQPLVTLLKPTTSAALILSTSLPSVYVNLSKNIFDGLQYWADDATQVIERAGSDGGTGKDSRDGSIVGSRYFASSRTGSGASSAITVHPPESRTSGTVVRVSIVEAFVRIAVPRLSEDSTVARPFDVQASDIDVLLEMKPEGKDETIVTVGVMDLSLTNMAQSGSADKLLSLTTPRSLTSVPHTPLKLQFISLTVPETTVKESKLRLSAWGLTCSLSSKLGWADDLASFMKAPPGAFESVIPSEKTTVTVKLVDCSLHGVAPNHPGAVLLHLVEMELGTSIVGNSPDLHFDLSVPGLAFLALDNLSERTTVDLGSTKGIAFWKKRGFALVSEISDLMLAFDKGAEGIRVLIDRVALRLYLCADTMGSILPFFDDLSSAFKPPPEERPPEPPRRPTVISQDSSSSQLMSSVDDLAFKRLPEIGPAPDMIYDDLPSNPDYLDESFSAAAGFRELRDDDLEDFSHEETVQQGSPGLVSNVGGETIKMLQPEGLNIVEHHFDSLPPAPLDDSVDLGQTAFRVIIRNADVNLFLYDGYDWARTRKTIEEEVKEMRKRLAKIRQLVASGQTQDPSIEDTSAVLFNSVYIGLDQDVDELEPGALIAAIDEELRDDYETVSQSSWQSLRPSGTSPNKSQPQTRLHGKRLARSKASCMEFRLLGAQVEVDQYVPEEWIVSRVFATVKDLEILDQIRTSTWDKFLTDLRSDSRGDVRETDSNMVKIELRSIHPVPGHPSEEARLRAKILPLRLYVDQDALDFLKKFFSFKDPHPVIPPKESASAEIYFQLAEVFPVDLKLDYKPRRVDYRALREGRTIELMNFFHFDGAEMTLRHITLSGITGWPRLFDLLNDLWTPDVKATQLVDVISGVAPIRSVVNVGSGIADLVLLPIAQYKKDGRIVRGVQKGATAFVKSTATEAIKLGARLATGTQVILEQAEGVLGSQSVTAETLQAGDEAMRSDEEEERSLISKYAEQPVDIREGVQSAYKSMRRNLNSAAQTILAVPMEVYERSGNEGAVRSVIRAVPIAVLKPMIGASEAVSKTLLGLHNTIDPNVRHDIEAKYKHR